MDLQRFIFNLQKDLQPCKSMSDDFAAVSDLVSIFERPEDLGENMTYNWLHDKETIGGHMHSTKASWAAGDFFGAG